MNSFYWQFGKVLTTSLVVFICGSIVFKNFWNAKSAFSTFLFVDSFQLWLQILRGYDWGILCDMVWRLFEKLCYMRHMRVRILGYFWLLEACQESCRKLWRGKSLRRPWTYFFVLVQGGFSQTFVHFTVTGLCWAETCLLPVQTRFRAMSQVPKGKYVAFFITWGVQVESAHCMKCWLNLLCLVSPPPFRSAHVARLQTQHMSPEFNCWVLSEVGESRFHCLAAILGFVETYSGPSMAYSWKVAILG